MMPIPRASALRELRQDKLGARHYNAVKTRSIKGTAHVPAFSLDSDILCVGFDEPAPNIEGPILCRTTPPAIDQKEATGLKVKGGSTWNSDTNKFYAGTSDGKAVIIDPLREDFQVLTGFAAGGGVGRTFYHPGTGDVWLMWGGSGNGWVTIAPDNSLTYIASATPFDFTFNSANSSIYFHNLGAVYKVDSGGSVSTLFTAADFAALVAPSVVTDFQIRCIEYIDTLSRVIFGITCQIDLSDYNFWWQIDGSDTVTVKESGGATRLWYSVQFDKLIMQHYLAGFRSVDPANFATFTDLSAGGDQMTAPKGCYCANISKVALGVLSGGENLVKFYGAGDL